MTEVKKHTLLESGTVLHLLEIVCADWTFATATTFPFLLIVPFISFLLESVKNCSRVSLIIFFPLIGGKLCLVIFALVFGTTTSIGFIEFNACFPASITNSSKFLYCYIPFYVIVSNL